MCHQGGSKHGRGTFEISYADCYAREISRFVCHNYHNFKVTFSTVAVAQWVRRWNSGHRVLQAEGSRPGGNAYHFSYSNDFYFSFVRPIMDFSDTVILCFWPDDSCQQNLRCFDMPLLSLGLFS